MDRSELLADVERRYQDALIVRRHQNARALIRRKLISDKLRATLEQRIPELEAEAKTRGITLGGWRPYPDKSGRLTFGMEVRVPSMEVKLSEPKTVRRKRPKKSRRRDNNPGELLAQLEASIAQQMEKA